MSDVTASIITIGNEILLGKTINTNLAWLASELASLGIILKHNVTIQDDAHDIRMSLDNEWKDYNVVIMTGGLGPTNDDITKAVIAEYFNKELLFNQDVWNNVQALFSHRGMPVPDNNRSQAMVPKDFTALENQRGTAPGLYYHQQDKLFFALPGVPTEMKFIFENHIKQIIKETYDLEPIYQRTVHTWNISESQLAVNLENLHVHKRIQMAWLPQTGRVDLRFYGTDIAAVDNMALSVSDLVAENFWGFDDDTPASILHFILQDRKMSIAVAESCTGGMVQEMITSIAGSSAHFLGGIVAYSNEIKAEILGVNLHTINQYGAVSENTALEMATQIRNKMGSYIGISTTGIAGPDGGTETKPVGMVCFGLDINGKQFSETKIFNGDRNSIRFKASEHLLIRLSTILREQY